MLRTFGSGGREEWAKAAGICIRHRLTKDQMRQLIWGSAYVSRWRVGKAQFEFQPQDDAILERLAGVPDEAKIECWYYPLCPGQGVRFFFHPDGTVVGAAVSDNSVTSDGRLLHHKGR